MYKLGITGGIGSGKTTVCKVFELFGIPVFYADQVAKDIMVTDTMLIADLTDTFGTETFLANGELNRKYLAGIVFGDEGQLARLNALVHPAVFRAFEEWVVHQNAPYILKEAALLFESGSYQMCDATILVISPEMSRIQRVMTRDKVSEAAVRERMSKQLSDAEKLVKAQHIIYNDDQHSIIEQVVELHKAILNTL